MSMHYENYKTILSPQNGMNIYRGCTHGCIYCDSRSACYQMKHDFEDIEVKQCRAGFEGSTPAQTQALHDRHRHHVRPIRPF